MTALTLKGLLMSEIKTYAVKEYIGSTTLLNKEQYEAMYTYSVEDPEGSCAELGKLLIRYNLTGSH